MARTIITAHSDDSYQRHVGAAGNPWGISRSATTATSMSNTVNNYVFGVYTRYVAGRGGNQFFITRSYFPFDCSGIAAGTHISNAYVSLYLDSLGTTDGTANLVVLLDAAALDDSTADYNNIFDGVSIRDKLHDDAVAVSSTAGHHIFPLNRGGRRKVQGAINDGGEFLVGLTSYTYDYSDSAPSAGGDYTKIDVYYASASAIYRPFLVVDFDDAVFMGANF